MTGLSVIRVSALVGREGRTDRSLDPRNGLDMISRKGLFRLGVFKQGEVQARVKRRVRAQGFKWRYVLLRCVQAGKAAKTTRLEDSPVPPRQP